VTKLRIEKLTPTVGVEVLGVDVDRLLSDDDLPLAVMAAVEQHGVLVFRDLHVDDDTQAAFCKRMGETVKFPEYSIPEVMVITLDPANPNAEYFRGNEQWHIDGLPDLVPAKASFLTAHSVSPEGGETEFVNTYMAYEDLSEDEKDRLSNVRVIHTLEAILGDTYADPTPEQVAKWKAAWQREHPLVWRHASGRRSLVIGATSDHVVGMDVEEGRALLADLLERATKSDRVFQHVWTVGDTVMWDNTGTLHRAMPYDPTSGREMHRTTLVGEEPIR
jgi:alpha-ketoglutarate-dependent taurine dioxygenase